MKNILLFEVKHCFTSRKFKIIFLMCTIIAIMSFLVNVNFYYGKNIIEIRSAFDVNIINGTKSSAIRMVILTLLPLISLLLYSDSFLIDYNTGMYKNIISRISSKKYILNKIIVIVTISFFTIFYMFLLNEILCLITFPIDGISDNFGNPSFVKTYVPDAFLALTKLRNPYLYDFIMIMIYSCIAMLHALLYFAISLFFKHKRVVFMIGYFIVWQVVDILFQALGIYKYHINYIINSNSGSFSVLIIWSMIILAFSTVLIKVSKYKNDLYL